MSPHLLVGTRASSANVTISLVGVGLLAVVFALLVGALAGLGSLLFLAPVVAVLAGLVLCFLPGRWVVWAILVAALFAVGPVIYYLKFETVRWIPPSLSLGLLIPTAFHALRAQEEPRGSVGWPAPLVWYLVFLAVLMISSIWTAPRFAEAVFALRTYVAYVPLAVALMLGLVAPRTQERMWGVILLCAAAQLPFVLYQVLVVTGYRVNKNALQDVVTGTFPGNVELGGANAGVAVFVLTAILVAISLWRARRIAGWKLAAVGISGLAVILLAEVKAIVLMIPVALVALYWRELTARPVRAFVRLAGGVLFAAAVFGAYNQLYYKDVTANWGDVNKPLSAWESVKNQLDPELEQRGAIMGRTAAFADWWRRTAHGNEIGGLLLGYGAGSTQFGRLGVGEVMERLRYFADNTGSGLLLWDAGVVGHLLLVIAFATAARAAFKLRDAEAVPVTHRAILHAVGVAWLVHLLCLPYKDFMFRTPPSQVLMFFMLGYVAYWSRQNQGHNKGDRVLGVRSSGRPTAPQRLP